MKAHAAHRGPPPDVDEGDEPVALMYAGSYGRGSGSR
jgi:hypothetical protein